MHVRQRAMCEWGGRSHNFDSPGLQPHQGLTKYGLSAEHPGHERESLEAKMQPGWEPEEERGREVTLETEVDLTFVVQPST